MIQYYFSFGRYAGFDRVFVVKDQEDVDKGDLIKTKKDYLLCLGDDIPFQELYKYNVDLLDYDVCEKKFMDENTLKYVFYLVESCYTTYKKILKLFVDFDMEKLLSRKLKTNVSAKYNPVSIDYENYKINFKTAKKKGQQLVVVPNLRTANQLIDIDSLPKGVRFLHSQSTAKTKQEAYWRIKTGRVGTLFCTYSQIFWNYRDLDNIIILDYHKWYYKNQQDPRYYVPDVLNRLSKTQESSYFKYGYSLDDKQLEGKSGNESQ